MIFNALKKYRKGISNSAREQRGKLFLETMQPQKTDRILDLGGGNGSHIAKILGNVKVESVTIADISKENLKTAREEYGYKTILLDESDNLPFRDQEFDIVFCNSVIEHVTLPKKQIWTTKSTSEFETKSFAHQQQFAEEIKRIAKSYFVQTPSKYFIIESHTTLPVFIVFFPRSLQISTIKFFNKFWLKQTTPDWNLLTYQDMQTLFGKAEIHRERRLGHTKSFIAVFNNA